MTRSPAKRYEPIWRDKVIYWFFRAFDFFSRSDDPIAPWYMAGPWCQKCRRLWRDDGPWPRRMTCQGCGTNDPVALKAWEERMKMPPGTGDLFGVNPLLAMLAAGALMLAKRRPAWWKALGLEARPESEEEAKRAYRRALGDAHPDRGGSRERMDQVRRAWQMAEKDYARRPTTAA